MKTIAVAVFVVVMMVILLWEDKKEFHEVKKVDLTKHYLDDENGEE